MVERKDELLQELISKSVWIGNAKEAENTSQILSLGISAMVCVAIEELPPPITRDLIFCRFPLNDGSDNSVEVLRTAVDTISKLINEKIPTFVYCGAGMSRSPVMAAAALSKVQGSDPDETLRTLFSDLPHDVSPQLWHDVKAACFQ
ncbi:MAG: dual specificity protein phosphatase family protein [Planctomycetes bacterium]|nr:dual specificity protein phosphatase family protein [Planctomycetota bacterium]